MLPGFSPTAADVAGNLLAAAAAAAGNRLAAAGIRFSAATENRIAAAGSCLRWESPKLASARGRIISLLQSEEVEG